MAHLYRPAPVGPLQRVRVWTDSGGTTRAVLTTETGQAIRNDDPVTGQPVDGLLVADGQGKLPLFRCASSPVYIGPAGSPTQLTALPVGEDQPAPSAPGGSSPVPANATGATSDSLSPDPILGSGTATEIVVPADCTILAVKVQGNAFPSWVIAADPTDFGMICLGDGSFDPTTSGAYIGYNTSGKELALSPQSDGQVAADQAAHSAAPGPIGG